MKFEDDELYAASVSADPSNATYLDYCDVTWHRPAYAACLNKIAERKEGRLDARFAGCSAAIGRKVCPAMQLQSEEKVADKAIYYINREKLHAFNQYKQEMDGQAFAATVDGDNIRKGKRQAKRQEYAQSAPPEAAVVTPEASYAAAINMAMKNELVSAPPAANEEVVKSALPVGSGMSMLERARLKLNSKG